MDGLDIVHDVYLFVLYDDVRYTTRDWHNRNRIKLSQGPRWLTVPVGSRTHRRICDVGIQDDSWQAKRWRALANSYSKAPFFDVYRPYFQDVFLGHRWRNLAELNQHLVLGISRDLLAMATDFLDSRAMPAVGKGQDRLLDLLCEVGADEYVSGPRARAYLDPNGFEERGIGVTWKNYAGYPEYDQLHPPFAHQVTVLDLHRD